MAALALTAAGVATLETGFAGVGGATSGVLLETSASKESRSADGTSMCGLTKGAALLFGVDATAREDLATLSDCLTADLGADFAGVFAMMGV
jgi:hypothetical protein